MRATSRQLVYDTLDLKNSGRVPRQLWTLPWAELFEKDGLESIRTDFPDDIIWDMPVSYREKPKTSGDPYEAGTYTDEWGCRFTGLRKGYVGEVKTPLVLGENWEDAGDKVRFPEELLTFDARKVDDYCGATDKFVLQTDFVRPFERMQFLRGSAELYMDIATDNKGMLLFLEKLHRFNLRVMEAWAKTKVDALFMMDDWGAQNNLLINPETWVRLFKPLYADYCAVARKYNKKIFMHSDGNTLKIVPHLIDIGVDAANLQLFCIGLDKLREYKGAITFWGELDRQWILPRGSVKQVKDAVREVYDTLWDNGGCVAQCEFGPGARAENVRAVFESWNELTPA